MFNLNANYKNSLQKFAQNIISKIHKPGATAFGVRLIDQFFKGK